MTNREKRMFIEKLTAWLEKELPAEEKEETVVPLSGDSPAELLTLKECAQTVKGLSEHTVRQLALQGKIPSIRTGAGRNGKILVSKSALLSYIGGDVK